MAAHQGNVSAFADRVRLIADTLNGRGVSAATCIPQLLTTLEEAEGGDTRFTRYMEWVTNNYNEGTTKPDLQALLTKAENKYREIHDPNGTGEATSQEKKVPEMTVLEAKFSAKIDELAKLMQNTNSGSPPPSGEKTPKKKGIRAQAQAMKPPKEGESHVKQFTKGDGTKKTYYYCDGSKGKHKAAWVAHKPEDCGKFEKKTTTDTSPPAGSATRLSALIREHDDDADGN